MFVKQSNLFADNFLLPWKAFSVFKILKFP